MCLSHSKFAAHIVGHRKSWNVYHVLKRFDVANRAARRGLKLFGN